MCFRQLKVSSKADKMTPPSESQVFEERMEVILQTEDVRAKYVAIRYSGKDGADRLGLYERFYRDALPPLLLGFERLLGGRETFLPGSLSVADFAVFNMLLYLQFPACDVAAASAYVFANFLSNFRLIFGEL